MLLIMQICEGCINNNNDWLWMKCDVGLVWLEQQLCEDEIQ